MAENAAFDLDDHEESATCERCRESFPAHRVSNESGVALCRHCARVEADEESADLRLTDIWLDNNR